MPRVYFEGWYDGVFAKAEDWYKGGLIYVNLKHYRPARQRRHRRQSVSGFICGWQAGGAGRRTVWSVHGADPAYKGNEACG